MKQYILIVPISVFYWDHEIAKIYDSITFYLLTRFTSNLVFKERGKKINVNIDSKKLYKILYGIVDNIEYNKICENILISIKDILLKQGMEIGQWNNVSVKSLNDAQKILDNSQKHIWLFYKNALSLDATKLNTQLNEILPYNVYGEEDYNALVRYFRQLIFDDKSDISTQQALINIDDETILTLNIDDSDQISDELIQIMEAKQGFTNTTLLRKLIDYTPQWRQRYFLVAQKRFTYLVMDRREGKTMTLTYTAIRQLFLPKQDIVYIVPTIEQADQPFEYIERFIRDIGDPALRFDKSRKIVSYETTRSHIKFVSAESRLSWRSKRADLLIYDEASFIDDDVQATNRPLISNTWWYQIAVSTVSPKTPINWFYFGFKSWEMGIRPDHLSIRRNLYQNRFIPEYEKKNLIDEYKNNPLMMQTELLALFPSVSWFNISLAIKHFANYITINVQWVKIKVKTGLKDLINEYKGFIMWYDPALRRDKWGLVLMWYYIEEEVVDGRLVEQYRFDTISACYINITDYQSQIWVIKYFQDALSQKPFTVAMDYTWAWMWVYELMQGMGIKNMIRIMRVGWWTQPVFEDGIWKVRKIDLETLLRASLGINTFLYNYLDELKGEVDTYGMQDRVDGSHFDQLSALMCANFACRKYIWDYVWHWPHDSSSFIDKVSDYVKDIFRKDWQAQFILDPSVWENKPMENSRERYQKFLY